VERHRHLLISDLDGTLLGDDEALEQFADWYGSHRDAWRLVYATGRNRASVASAISDTALPEPDALVTSVGTEVHVGDALAGSLLKPGTGTWDAEAVRAVLEPDPTLTRQPREHQTPTKVSYWAHGRSQQQVTSIAERLAAAGISANVLYSSGRDLDVIPGWAGKGVASRTLARAMGFAPGAVIACGDSGNDVDLFRQGFRGVAVSNAEAALLDDPALDAYRSSLGYARGVLDGVHHWTRRCCWPDA
jgi:sucrose-6F-phosphate phosphohydrolase